MPLPVRAMMRPTIGKLNRYRASTRWGRRHVHRLADDDRFRPIADMVGETYECHSMALDFPG